MRHRVYRPSFADWPQKRQAIEELIQEVDSGLAAMVTDDRALLIRGACLARSARLLHAMLALHDAGIEDVTTIPLRPLLEQWLIALWVEFRPDEAVDLLLGEYEASLEKINRLAELGFDPALYGPGAELPTWETLSQWVGNHLEAEGQNDARKNLDFTYNLIYRGESFRSVHAGLGTVIDHLEEVSDDHKRVVPIRRDSGDGRGEILWAATLVCMLAFRAAEAFGLPSDRLNQISPRLPPAPGPL